MTREEATAAADETIEELLRSGDKTIFELARGPDGRIDQMKLVAAAMAARADLIELWTTVE